MLSWGSVPLSLSCSLSFSLPGIRPCMLHALGLGTGLTYPTKTDTSGLHSALCCTKPTHSEKLVFIQWHEQIHCWSDRNVIQKKELWPIHPVLAAIFPPINTGDLFHPPQTSERSKTYLSVPYVSTDWQCAAEWLETYRTDSWSRKVCCKKTSPRIMLFFSSHS